MSVYVSRPTGAYVALSCTGPAPFVVIPNVPGRRWPEDGMAVATSSDWGDARERADALDKERRG